MDEIKRVMEHPGAEGGMHSAPRSAIGKLGTVGKFRDLVRSRFRFWDEQMIKVMGSV
jgi:hypothetical protein